MEKGKSTELVQAEEEARELPSRTEKAFCKDEGNDPLLSIVNRKELK